MTTSDSAQIVINVRSFGSFSGVSFSMVFFMSDILDFDVVFCLLGDFLCVTVRRSVCGFCFLVARG